MKTNLKIINTKLNEEALREFRLVDDVNAYIEKTGYTAEQIAERIGADQAEFNAWLLKHTMNKQISREMNEFLEIEDTAWDNIKWKSLLRFAETSIYNLMKKTFDSARKRGILIYITGDAGAGKTKSIERYSEENELTFVFKANESSKGPSDIVDELENAILSKTSKSFFYQRTVKERTKDIIEYLNKLNKPDIKYWFDPPDPEERNHPGINPIVIVDQADGLSKAAFDLLRTLYDEADIGIALVGTKGLHKKLMKDSDCHTQVKSRIPVYLELEHGTKEDFSNILDTNWYGLDEAIKKRMYLICDGNFRNLTHLIFNAREMLRKRKNRGRFLDEEILNEAWLFKGEKK